MPVYLTPILTGQKTPSWVYFYSKALGAVSTLRTFVEQQREEHTVFLRQLRVLEREMKALQVTNSTQTTLKHFFVAN
jgi:hypothetical protein